MRMVSSIKAPIIVEWVRCRRQCAANSRRIAPFARKTKFACLDYKEVVAQATVDDLIYLDPPYQGVCGNRDPRYLKSVLFDEFVEVLETLNFRNISYLVSYDGRTGEQAHGRRLPERLRLHLVELKAGRSSQATLLGRDEVTVESLYLSPALAEKLNLRRSYLAAPLNNWLCWRPSDEQAKVVAGIREAVQSRTPKRPKTVIDHILNHGFITTQELKILTAIMIRREPFAM